MCLTVIVLMMVMMVLDNVVLSVLLLMAMCSYACNCSVMYVGNAAVIAICDDHVVCIYLVVNACSMLCIYIYGCDQSRSDRVTNAQWATKQT